MSPPARWTVILNPASGGGRARRRWPALARALARLGLPFELLETAAPGQASRLAGDAARAGAHRLLAAGGDGTLHEVVNGLLTLPDEARARLAVAAAPLGSGNDWSATHGMPRAPARLAEAMARDRTRRVDLGLASCAGSDGSGRTVAFHTLAGAGLDAAVIRRTPARGPRRLAYLFGLARALAAHRAPLLTVDGDGFRHEGPCLLAIAAIGPRCGGGMRLAPAARPDDGWLDLVAVARIGRARLLALAPGLYSGAAAADPAFRSARCRAALIGSRPPCEVEADGELVGGTPLSVRILPAALGILDCRPGAVPD